MAWQSWKKSGRFPTVLLLHCAVAESFAQSLERWKPQKQPAEEAYTVRILNVGKMRAMSSDPDDVVGANQYDLQNDVLLTVFRIRKIIILFTLSPVKNSLLQQEWGKKLTGFFEWQSTLKHTQKIIIERFFKDPKWENDFMPTEVGTLVFKEEYYEIVRGILNCLKLAWLAVEKVSNHDAILLRKNRILL